MASLKFMNESSTRGVFLSIALLLSMALITIPNAYAEVSVESFALGETTILEVVNESNEEIDTLRIWLGSDFSFKSFKTEEGWAGEKTPQGVIIFTSTEGIKSGESVKFGVKTDNPNPGINWKALNSNKQMDAGKVLPDELPGVDNTPSKQEQPPPRQEPTPEKPGASMTAESSFRIIPKELNVGSSIRVTGDNFGASQEFDFYIGSEKLGSFETDENGHFMTTMKIPDSQGVGRVDFIVKDMDGEEKKVSLRIDEIENRIPPSDNIKLTVKGLPEVIHRGDLLEISGTGDPGSTITGEITNPSGEITKTRITEIDSKGNWRLDPIIVDLDAEFGEHNAKITDGREDLQVRWKVESNKKIIIVPDSLKYEPGETIKFNGTALPNKSIELVLEDPLGKEVISDILQTNGSGFVELEFQTEQNTAEGTYTLIATQGSYTEFIFVGLGQLPSIPINFEFDKVNYKQGETATISLSGKSSEEVSLLILDPSDRPKGDNATSIKLQADGKATHLLDLKGYSSGIYSAIISNGGERTKEFTVGLQEGVDRIIINTPKENYLLGESVLIIGYTEEPDPDKKKEYRRVPNIVLTLVLMDPDGKEIKVKEAFSDKDGSISEVSFRIPSEANHGTWVIKAQSGSAIQNTEIKVLPEIEEGMVVSVTKDSNKNKDHFGQHFIIKVIGAKQTVKVEIVDKDGENIDPGLRPHHSANLLEGGLIWRVPPDTEPGTYTVKVKEGKNSAETTFEIP